MVDVAEQTQDTTQNATELASAIKDGKISSLELVEACLDHINAHEDTVQAWAYLDPELAKEQARQADDYRHRGMALGPLHGVPVGIKDIIDTDDMPTEFGTVLHEGHRPGANATLVNLLKEAGAIILGKTVTTEMAVLTPGKTRNPHNPEHTPGGSSSGSAAAVASGMVPLAIGSQTNGSMIRPASFCGVFGFKPTYGGISRHRVMVESPPLDTMGIFARSLEDLALVADVLMVYDTKDRDMQLKSQPKISEMLAQDPPVDPHLAFVRTPSWDLADDSTKDGLRELIEHVGGSIDLFDLPSIFDDVHQALRDVMDADLAKNFSKEYETGKDKLSPLLVEMIERGQKVTAVEYNRAMDLRRECIYVLNEIFEDYDAILTPSAIGEAPKGLETTGNPDFCTIWNFCGTPALNLPVLQGENDLPIGVQLVSNKGDDARLFRTARWLLGKLS